MSQIPPIYQPLGSTPGNSTGANCDTRATAMDWVTLILSMMPIVLAWWLPEIPKIWKHGIRAFFNAITWQALRLVFPAIAGIFAVIGGQDPASWPKLYFVGPSIPGEPDHMPVKTWIKVAVRDAVTIVSTVLSLVQFCSLPAGTISKGFNLCSYAFPTLPATIVGLWTIVASLLRLKRWLTIVIGCVVTLGIGAAITAWMQSSTGSANVWFAYLGYAYVASPAVLLFLWFLPFVIGLASLSIFTRMYGVGAVAVVQDSYFPFCSLVKYRWVLAGIYLAFGTAAGLLATVAVYKKVKDALEKKSTDKQRRRIKHMIASREQVIP